MTTSPAKPDRRLKLSIDGADVEIFMSFGLLDELITKFGDDTGIENCLTDNKKRKELVAFMLQPRGKTLQYGIKDFDFANSEIDPETIQSIFKFVLTHVTDFFISGGEVAVGVLNQFKQRADSLTPSEPGSPA